MGIGLQPRPALATAELVALSPGLLGVSTGTATEDFPEPPPPPGPIGLSTPDDWEAGAEQAAEAPESIDDFAEELPPSEPSAESVDDFVEELPPSSPAALPDPELPSSGGTPSLKQLAHLAEPAAHPADDDFLAHLNVTSEPSRGVGAPTIDVSDLERTGTNDQGPSINVTDLGQEPVGPASPRPALQQRAKPQPAAPTAKPAEPSRSSFGVPLLLLLAAVAGFLIWKRSASPEPIPLVAEASVTSEPPSPAAAPVPPEPAAVAPPVAEPPAVVAPAAAAPGGPPATPATVSSLPSENSKRASVALPVTAPAPRSAETAPAVATAAAPAPDAPATEAAAEPAAVLDADPAGPFDRAAASAALNESVAQASACRKEGDPSGVASVVITFATSGRVTSANVSGPPFAGTPTGGCIAAALRRTKVPPFSGDRVTISKTVVIQ